MGDSISRYIDYAKEYPSKFKQNELINIVLEERELRNISQQTDEALGVIYENKYITLIVDLIRSSNSTCYPYARILNKNEYNGVVIIPMLGEKIVFLKQFRHAIRDYDIELPRGFSESNASAEENVELEVYEELGAKAYDIQYIGDIFSDTGLVGGVVKVFKCRIDKVEKLEESEGIEEIVLFTIEQIREQIKENKIRDSFSISAIYKYLCMG